MQLLLVLLILLHVVPLLLLLFTLWCRVLPLLLLLRWVHACTTTIVLLTRVRTVKIRCRHWHEVLVVLMATTNSAGKPELLHAVVVLHSADETRV